DDGSVIGWQRSREARRAEEKARAAQEVPAREPERRGAPTDASAPAFRPADRGIESTLRVLGPAADPRLAWALSNRGRDRIALVSIHLG
ncbi:hypothetical protein ABTM58_20055, partial [Acinetobacter baumannii]